MKYDGCYRHYIIVEDMNRSNHAVLAEKLISRRALAAMFSPDMLDTPRVARRGGKPALTLQ